MVSLNRLLDGLDVHAEPFAVCELHPGAELPVQNLRSVHIHYVLQGQGVARSAHAQDLRLTPHTVLVVPVGYRVAIVCPGDETGPRPDPVCQPLPGGWDRITVGSGSGGLVITCANLTAVHRDAQDVFAYLRAPLIEHVEDEPAFRHAFHLLLAELASPQAGTPILVATLLKQCLIVLLRRYAQDGVCRAPWLAALEDPQLGSVLAAMVDHPDEPFTLDNLAQRAGMSRATFTSHFKRVFGRSPMDVLREVRLRRAAHLLMATDLPVKRVAAQVGFASRSHFSRAFRSYSGQHPARFRNSA